MQVVRPAQMFNFVGKNHVFYPGALGIHCGHCRERSRFIIEDPHAKFDIGGRPVTLPCPNCHKTVRFYAVAKPRNKTDIGWLYVHPHAEERARLDLAGIKWPEPLIRAYEECNGALDAGLWIAAAGQARRTLEGVLKHLLADHVQPRDMVASLLRKLPNHVQLDQPIKDVADVLKEGGNVASHFDLNATPDEQFARGVIQLLDDLIEYLFLLPANVAEVRAQLEKEAQQEAGGDEATGAETAAS